ncbi:hypothetical protein pEaSNUABM13_00282 [Erwinia phage pEa_SNUABM_13]|nr:hypothetical protein pEaSNUABM13_00282 [Erwinia phage pEa_SNUABM_13]QYW03582.1 hypothetical protein pEaSNUABM34_00280 [Erwinia phage pEa_SNUABM_34]QYW03923.1 hypothetical protein pEaSNUABM45_00280 [Erwinia phage pEa_SNUABM_45]QYW04264.1 hypothetical protein pEaSNUABM46_00280 [Erwinia phage pEa_SNUABM_46]QYW05294.1 hypothetical protein pEaSNUABM21_00280 [Erwinia phage pEa_SNUABM_21]QYW05634.1 hypothetical protein pEaSNUABM25_00278 [Erwinia phage pEa_SNUABM_25]
MKERRNYYWDSPFYYGLILWRKRMRNVVLFLIAILIYHGTHAPVVENMWMWTGTIFGILFLVCYIKMWEYERMILEAMGPLNNNCVIGALNFESLERRHAVWYRKKFKSEPPKTNTYSREN